MSVIVFDAQQRKHRPQFYIKQGRVCTGLEQPERAEVLLEAVKRTGSPMIKAEQFSLEPILAVHSERYLEFLLEAHAYARTNKEKLSELVPAITRDSSAMRYPTSLSGRTAWHMYDLYSPIGPETYGAALGAAYATLTGARLLRAGAGAVYALCRPPGHHAHADFGGGYCYLNNAAIAAQYLSSGGRRVAILDIDADHGNGTQSIFYERDDILHVSLHADPREAYPYFTGHEEERGRGPGIGATINVPLKLGTNDEDYLDAFVRALEAVSRFGPDFCVVALGVDGHADEPNQLFALTTDSFHRIGEALAGLGLPILFTQEGGYNLETLGGNVLAVIGPSMMESCLSRPDSEDKLMEAER